MTEPPRDPTPGPPQPAYPSQSAAGSTSTGLDPRLSGVLAYLFWIVGGILFLAVEKQSSIVRFHAAQSIVLSIAEIIFAVVLMVLAFIPVVGALLWLVYWLGTLALTLFLMYKAYMLERYKLPLLGDYAEKLAAKPM